MVEHWTANLARTLKLIREIKGLGLREHARLLDMSPATLSRIESGKPCDVDTLLKLKDKTGAKLETLLGLNT